VVAPLFWRFTSEDSSRTVVFPLWWDFRSEDSRVWSVFPFVWHGSSPEQRWTAVLNVVYISGERAGVPYYSLDVFPFFRYARPAPGDLEWQVLLGLAGYGRRGDRRWADVFWVPVEFGRPAASDTLLTADLIGLGQGRR
jgi:hypothetical protein